MKRVLVVYKKSFLEAHASDRTLLRRLSKADRERYRRADESNRQALDEVVGFLQHLKVGVQAVYRGLLAAGKPHDLVVTVGGDGTFFAASHYVKATPIFAINSDPENSLGLFTAADHTEFRAPLAKALEGKLHRTLLNRLTISVNGKTLRERVVNDVLFAHRNPASMSRYQIAIDRKREAQRSSGVWIASAGGSTAGIRAAGGERMAIESTQIQVLVREPYGWPRSDLRLLRGYAHRSVELTVMMTEAAIWIDGARIRHDLSMGDKVRIITGAAPLVVLGYDDERRVRLFP